jgi:hypothetical protein
MKKVLTRGSRVGLCNICGNACTLTEDHVPPKGSIDPRKVGIRSLVQTIDPVDHRIIRISQNGVKFRTLCSQCNNVRLGQKFDPALNHFSRKVAPIIRSRSQIVLPPKVEIQIQPQRVARSIVGHLLAVGIRENMSDPLVSAPMPDLMRQYFLDETTDFPANLNLYFWIYPVKRQVILRGVGILSGNQIVVGDFIKYFPFSFWLTHQAPVQFIELMNDREVQIRGCALDDWRTLSIGTDKQDTFRPNWPEVVDSKEMMLINDGLCFLADAT